MENLAKLERLTNLVMLLLSSRRPVSLQHIVSEVPGYPLDSPVAARQAFERDKKLLRQEGVPILTEKMAGGDQLGYRINPEDYYLPELDLSPVEQVALNLAVAGVHLPDGSGMDALLKLGVVASHHVSNLADLPVPHTLPDLHRAIAQRAPVTFVYRSFPRGIDPYGLAFRAGNWYLVGWDHDRLAMRSFRPDRIDGGVTLGPEDSFEVPIDFDPARALPDPPWTLGGRDVIDVRVLIDASQAALATAELGGESVVETRSDGSVIVALAVSNTGAFRSWLFDHLDHAEVLSPPDLRDEVIGWLRQMIAEVSP
ncbi:MAG: helix-turn-helix transcriptional regulator [Acidimicrobiales bacterium]